MSLPTPSLRPMASLKQAICQCHAERYQRRRHASTQTLYPSLQTRYPPPSAGFRTSQTTKQNRTSEHNMKKIPVIPPPRSTLKQCPNPIKTLTTQQLETTLDPTGARTRLFAPSNPDRVQPGDILHVRFKSGDPFSGICLNIRQRHQPIDTAVLLRNQLTRIGVEMWVKVYSPNVEGIEVVQRKEKRARRAKLYYYRQARHDVGSVEGVVRQYLRQKVGSPLSSQGAKGRTGDSNRKKNNKRGRN